MFERSRSGVNNSTSTPLTRQHQVEVPTTAISTTSTITPSSIISKATKRKISSDGFEAELAKRHQTALGKNNNNIQLPSYEKSFGLERAGTTGSVVGSCTNVMKKRLS